jgi:uncharacterized protein YbaR (Trm112 family)
LSLKAVRLIFKPYYTPKRDIMIDEELLEILACPEDKSPVQLADQSIIDGLNERIAQGSLTNRGGQNVEKQIDGGLVRADGAYLYPIDDGIPIMLIDEAIPLT